MVNKELCQHSIKPAVTVNEIILKKSSGKISMLSMDNEEGLSEKTSPFDMFAQVIEGSVDFMIRGSKFPLKKGESIIIPAHAPNSIKSGEKFKLILTVLKSGYE